MNWDRSVRTFGVAALFLGLAVLATWPLATDIAGLSTFSPATNDPHFNIYLIFWGAHALTSDPLNLHHTNMFYPERYTFAYSDIELSHSLLTSPAIFIFYNPYLTYNLLLFAAVILGGVGFYLLARKLTGSGGAALLGAAIYVFNPAHFGRYLQIQFFGDHWLPWVAWALLNWLERIDNDGKSTWRQALVAACFFCLHFLSGSHNAVFGTIFAGAMVLYYFFAHKLWRKAQFWTGLAIMGIVALIVLGPVFYPYLIVESKITEGRISSIHTLLMGSATHAELLAASSKFYLWLDQETGWPSAMAVRRLRGYLFPGFIALALAACGFVKRRTEGDRPSDWRKQAALALDLLALAAALGTVFLAVTGIDVLIIAIIAFPSPPAWQLAVVAILAVAVRLSLFREQNHVLINIINFCRSRIRGRLDQMFWLGLFLFGLLAAIGPPAGLYNLLAGLPLLRAIRVPSRFILLAVFALSVLAAFGAAAVIRRLKPKPVKAWIALSLIILAFAAESTYAPLPVHRTQDGPELYKWLARQEGEFAVVEFPVDPRNYTASARQVFYSIYHWKRLLVGYSGYQSKENYDRLNRLNESFPSDTCLDELESLSVKYVIVFRDRLAAEDIQNGSSKLESLGKQYRLETEKEFGEAGELVVYLLKSREAE